MMTDTPRQGSSAGRSFGKWFGIITAVFVCGVFGISLVPKIWHVFNPMASKSVDRSRPALLTAIANIADYRAASAQLNVVVDIEKDAKYLPDALRGERTVLLAVGHVDAGVDFSRLDKEAVTIDEGGKKVTIILPHAQLRTPELDLKATRVLVEKRGALDRLGSVFGNAPGGERRALDLAQSKLEKAAKDSDVLKTAEINTAAMVSGLVRALGYDDVVVTFGEPPGVTTTVDPAKEN